MLGLTSSAGAVNARLESERNPRQVRRRDLSMRFEFFLRPSLFHGSEEDGLAAVVSHVGGEGGLGGDGLGLVFDLSFGVALRAGVGVDFGGVGDAGFEEGERDVELTSLAGVHAADEPVVSLASGGGDVLADLAVEDFGFVPGGVDFFKDVEFGFAFVFFRTVIPEEELEGAEVDDGGGELMGAGCLHPSGVVADGVVGRATEEAGEGEDEIVFGVWHFLISADAFLGEEIGVGAAPAGGAVVIVDVDDHFVFGAFLDGFVEPFGPLLGAGVDEAELDAGDAPFLEEGEEVIELFFEGAAVDVEDDSDVVFLSVVDDFLKIKGATGARRINGDGGGIGVVVSFGAIPAGVDEKVGRVHLFDPVDGGEAGFGVELGADGFAGANPRGVGDGAGVVEIGNEVVVCDELAGGVANHDVAPRGGVGRLGFDVGIEMEAEAVRGVGVLKAEAGVVDHAGFPDGEIGAAGDFDNEGALGAFVDF